MTRQTALIAKRACDLMEQNRDLSLRAAVSIAQAEQLAASLLGPPARRWGDESEYLHQHAESAERG
jgi:hypothetical protein